jgi:hypothetical protein
LQNLAVWKTPLIIASIRCARIEPTMRLFSLTTAALIVAASGPVPAQQALQPRQPAPQSYLGFDANEYPGDNLLPALRKQFAFTGYWLNNPPGADHNPWAGKRDLLLHNGFGFLVVFNGCLDKEILKAQKAGRKPATFGAEDAASAAAAARREGFPPRTILFLDQEEGGRLLPEQANYLFGWTEAVARTEYKPGVYASGQPVPDGTGPDGKPATITTIQDIRAHVTVGHLHQVAFWVAQDACPPAPGCVANPAHPPPPDLSGTLNADAWQFAQSPRRKSITQACGVTYSHDGNCYAPGLTQYELDLSSSATPDPSQGR